MMPGVRYALICLIFFVLPGVALSRQADDLVLSGRVLSVGSREPLGGVRVELHDLSVGGNTARTGITATTDAGGEFRFPGLRPGRYEVRPLHAFEESSSNRMYLGQRRRVIVELMEGGIPANVEVWMPLLSTISGRVLGPDGVPVEGVPVIPMRVEWNEGARLVAASDGFPGLTDPEGRYAVRVPAGEYYLYAGPRQPELGPLNSYYPNLSDPELAIPIR